MPAYMTTADYRDYAGAGSSDADDSDAMIELALDEASDWVDLWCGRTFGPRATTIRATGDPIVPVARAETDETYWGRDSSVLQIKPVHGTIEVHAGTRDDGFDLVNGTHWRPIFTPDGLSIYMLERIDARKWSSRQAYSVYAELGCAETPAAIKHSVLEKAALRRLETPRAKQAAQLPVEGDEAGVSRDAQSIIDKYLREYLLIRV